MHKVLKNKKYMVRDTDSGLSYGIFRSSLTVNNDFKKNVPEHISEHMGIYVNLNREFYYVRWDENDKKYYAKMLNISMKEYLDLISETPPNWNLIKERLDNNQNPEYEAIPDDDDKVEPPMGFESGGNPDEEKKTKPTKEKNKYSDAEIEKYNKFVQEFNLMMSEQYITKNTKERYKKFMKQLQEDRKLFEMINDEKFSGDKGKEIIDKANQLYRLYKKDIDR